MCFRLGDETGRTGTLGTGGRLEAEAGCTPTSAISRELVRMESSDFVVLAFRLRGEPEAEIEFERWGTEATGRN